MTNIEEQAVWKPYPEFPFIEANQFGEIRTRDRTVIGKDEKKYRIKGRVLKQQRDRGGYMFVSLTVNQKKIHLKVHRIVATCYIPNSNNYPEVNHIDGNPTNNTVSNLEWCTHEYNIAYREKFGISAKEASKVLRKPVIAINPETLEVFWFESQCEAGRQLDISHGNIPKVIKGHCNKTGGYWFCDADEKAIEKTRAKFGDEIARKVEELMNENYN